MSDGPTAKEVFADAIELKASERGKFVRRACGQNAELLAEVLQLIDAHQTAEGFLEMPTIGPGLASAGAVGEAPGSLIGRYRLIQVIGEGGFGVVYLAEQSEPVVRRVALKIIKPGMDTARVIARFEAERQALAVMNHPNIAQVLDAGTTLSGRPYFVMELVPGTSITSYCDENSLTIPARLEVFTQVCQAVQHAHIKGVIHRDINPRNVLVATQDGRALARVIDFGIARAIDQHPTERTAFTELGQFIGTPEYMSPEQTGGGLDIDTRTDVYSLGVLLYELLTGSTPFDPRRLRSAALDELRRIIREDEPPRPSTRLLALKGTLSGVAANRRVDPGKLETLIRGELDWIVLKALDKDRARRYDSPAGLAADLQRYLTGAAVEAAPPSRWYRFRKSVRRHRVGVSAGALIGVALVAGLGVALWQAGVAARERDAARTSASAALAARAEADARRGETERVAAFQASQLRGIDPRRMGTRLQDAQLADAKASMERAGLPPDRIAAKQRQLAELLKDVNPTNVALAALDENIFARAMRAVDDQFKDQPLVKARLLQTLADTLTGLGLFDRAMAAQSEALAIRRRELGGDHADTLESINQMGSLFNSIGRLPDAEACFSEAYAGMARVLGANDRGTLGSLSSLALLVEEQSRFPEAERLMSEALERSRRTLGPDDPDTLSVANSMGGLLCDEGKFTEAEPYFRDVLERRRRTQGDDNVETLRVINNVATVVQRQGRLAEAEPYFREALERARRVEGEDHPDTIRDLNNLAFVLFQEGKLAESEPLMQEALERYRRILHEDHWETLQATNNMGMILLAQGKATEAEPFLREALDRRRRVLGETHPGTLQSVNSIGVLLREQGKLEEAEPYMRQALDGRRRVLGDLHPDTLESIHETGVLMLARGKPNEAEVLLREALTGRERAFGRESTPTVETRAMLGASLTGRGRFEEAEGVLLEAERVLALSRDAPPKQHAVCLRALVALYEAWNNAEPGKGHDATAAEWNRKLSGIDTPSAPPSAR